jgi:hypothetical protein
MRTRQRLSFDSVRTEGGMLPADLLERISSSGGDVPGLKPADYHLPERGRLNEAISRTWNACRAAWASFRRAEAALSDSDTGTSVTRERWLLPLFMELGYGRLLTARAVEVDGRSYAVSHAWHHTPIHLAGCRIDLDRRTAGVAGAARTAHTAWCKSC